MGNENKTIGASRIMQGSAQADPVLSGAEWKKTLIPSATAYRKDLQPMRVSDVIMDMLGGVLEHDNPDKYMAQENLKVIVAKYPQAANVAAQKLAATSADKYVRKDEAFAFLKSVQARDIPDPVLPAAELKKFLADTDNGVQLSRTLRDMRASDAIWELGWTATEKGNSNQAAAAQALQKVAAQYPRAVEAAIREIRARHGEPGMEAADETIALIQAAEKSRAPASRQAPAPSAGK
jgi:hypothetical protein